MHTDHYFDSCGEGRIHYSCWVPEGKPKAIVQILHGIAEYGLRYNAFAEYLNGLGYLVVAEDHMGHGASVSEDTTRGYFAGGWSAAVADSHRLTALMKEAYPDVPYILFGHSMGSFMTRTILSKYSDDELAGAVICGTGWINPLLVRTGLFLAKVICAVRDDRKPSGMLQVLAFSGSNKRIKNPRTPFDWLNRDPACVDAYVADEQCGFLVAAGLLRDMFSGIVYIQKRRNIAAMNKDTPIFLIAGGDDPVGAYGKGVEKTARAFRKSGVKSVELKLYPEGRHEILNELNHMEVWQDVANWLDKTLVK